MKQLIIVFGVIAVMVGTIVFALVTDVNKATPEPMISITVGEQAIKPIHYGDRYNKTRKDIERFIDMPFTDGSWEAVPYVKIGDEVVIKFENFESDNVRITDDLLRQDATFMYDEKSTIVHDLDVIDGKVHFSIEQNSAVHLSSNSESYQPGHVIRAFVIRTEIDQSSFAFAFVVRTDP